MGIVNIDDLQKRGVPGQTIENIIRNDVITLSTEAHAKEAMDAIQNQRADFVVVLNDKQKVVGIITKGSIARSLSTTLWGENNV